MLQVPCAMRSASSKMLQTPCALKGVSSRILRIPWWMNSLSSMLHIWCRKRCPTAAPNFYAQCVKWQVVAPKCCKRHVKWDVLVSECCKFYVKGPGRYRTQEMMQRQIWKIPKREKQRQNNERQKWHWNSKYVQTVKHLSLLHLQNATHR